jgi:hypothetical protein
MSFHTCWNAQAEADDPGIPASDLLDRLAIVFPVHEFDAEGARADAAKRLTCLTALGLPEEMLSLYRDARPVRVRLADDPRAPFALDFTIWPTKEGLVKGVQVSFATAQHEDACYPLLLRMTDLLGWGLEEDTEAS